jgi:spermidine synthase
MPGSALARPAFSPSSCYDYDNFVRSGVLRSGTPEEVGVQKELWKANAIVFVSSFCVMVIELIAARILAPFIGVSLYTWTSIIGVILAGIALGNFLGGKLADKYPTPSLLAVILLAGSLATIAILPIVKWAALASWANGWPLILSFMVKTACVFLLPAVILSMVSPLVIRLTLSDVGKTGGVVGTIYAFSTAGSIVGTFITGFYLILWFGTRSIVWLAAGVLIVLAVAAWLSWKVPVRWKLSAVNLATWGVFITVVCAAAVMFQFRSSWQENYTAESNYYAINVTTENTAEGTRKALSLDHLVHSFVYPDQPTRLEYGYETTFTELASYVMRDHPAPRLLHLGGGGYSFSRYMAILHPSSVNEVIEIDPEVTRVAYSQLGLPADIKIKTYNQDARLFLIERNKGEKYNIVAGDVFNDLSTPFHLTSLEFDRLVKANLADDGIYMVNIIDDFQKGRYMPSFIYTLQQAFQHVTLLSPLQDWSALGLSTFVIAASDRYIDPAEYLDFLRQNGVQSPSAFPSSEAALNQYLSQRQPILLSDDHVPTDILVAPLIGKR